ncbi:hypothetical protein EOK75_01125 [Pseudorhodobacter turbinis]|uniref:Transposase DDE domain-containing protein n=1 Tax=Pseudorhodobacter turbinis TaxID=2500533 RepID=A0A4P8ECG0_9RHOB|nr:transposase [Pseudorhodobacter turbinis]QCO54541.1 hypothetical protein EOK75_01125 [Pseudorhodobacter turbinis]
MTGDPGAVVLREILKRSRIVDWMTSRMRDPRRQEDVTHDLASLIRTCMLLAAQGWRDHDDADTLRHDPAFRLAASFAAGWRRSRRCRGSRRCWQRADYLMLDRFFLVTSRDWTQQTRHERTTANPARPKATWAR